jgi:hypothetical protein
MSSAVVKINEFNVSNLNVGQQKILESGGKMASLGYGGGKFTTQIGPLTLPYGMNVFDKAGPVKYSMDLSLRGYDENPKIRTIYDAFMALDEYMIDQGVKNSRAWFKADLNRDVVRAFYTPMVKIAKDADGNPKPYPPTIKINLRKQNDTFEVKVYDEQKRPYEGVPLEDLLVKGASLTTLIQCTSVWFAGSKFGLSWKALQIRMDKVPESIRGYAFVDDEDSSSRMAKAPAPVANQNRFAELDEEEAEEEEAPAPAPAPAPVAAKKQSVLTAMMPSAAAPAPAAQPTMDDDAEDFEPVAVPKKTTTITTKKIVKKSVAGK